MPDPVIVFTMVVTAYGYVMAIIAVLARQRLSRPAPRQEDNDLLFVLLVPALNEEKVIGTTLSSLLRLTGNFLVMMIDDASDDGTVETIRPFLADPRVMLLERPRAVARTGKGASLNAGFAEVLQLEEVGYYGADHVIVVVFDSDGRVDPKFLETVAPYFADPNTAGVQTAVRMYNAGQNLLTFWQHFEFIVWGEVLCRAKDWLGSATLGGNGQCVRLSALMDLGNDPWRPSLVDDLDLALRLLVRGWSLHFCPWVSVWQEAVPDIRRLIRQRSRWMQGHFASWNYLPEIARSELAVHTRLDLLIFLLLPASFVPIGIASVLSWVQFVAHLFTASGLHATDVLGWYVLGFAMAPLSMWAWRQTTDQPTLWRTIRVCHVYVFYSFVWFMAALVASWNVLRVQRSWAKTSRVGLSAFSRAESNVLPFENAISHQVT
jgi:1,2-diacylglycerol 3-beta-glucosyltransferase